MKKETKKLVLRDTKKTILFCLAMTVMALFVFFWSARWGSEMFWKGLSLLGVVWMGRYAYIYIKKYQTLKNESEEETEENEDSDASSKRKRDISNSKIYYSESHD